MHTSPEMPIVEIALHRKVRIAIILVFEIVNGAFQLRIDPFDPHTRAFQLHLRTHPAHFRDPIITPYIETKRFKGPIILDPLTRGVS